MSQVKVVAHPETGLIITPSTKTEGFGTIRVDSINRSMEGGFLNVSRRTAFIRGRMEDLEGLGLKAGQALQGRIQKKESFNPFYEGQTSKQYPEGAIVNGVAVGGQAVLTNGRETYLQYEYTANPDAHDVWVGETPEGVSQNVEASMEEQNAGTGN